MYKQLMSLLMVATLACGVAFAEEETKPALPAVEATEEAKESKDLASCPCGNKNCGHTLAECGCNKKKKNESELANDETQKISDVEGDDESDKTETLAVEENTVETVEEVEEVKTA